jgi:hypothetical protein
VRFSPSNLIHLAHRSSYLAQLYWTPHPHKPHKIKARLVLLQERRKKVCHIRSHRTDHQHLTGTPFLPTPFQYTTTINGVKTVVQDTFTPTLGFPTTVPTEIPATGTILGYSEWLAQYGATATNSASSPLRWPTERMWSMVLGILGGLAGGVVLVGL